MLRALVRADASATLGHGHVMRCLALAGALRQRGVQVGFLQRSAPGDAAAAIGQAGFALHPLPPPRGDDPAAVEAADAAACAALLQAQGGADLLVVDHYRLTAAWVQALRPLVRRVLVIDDLADRPLAGDLLLDQNWHEAPAARYAKWFPAAGEGLYGPAHALLRPAFSVPPPPRDGRLRRVVLAFGGSDPADATAACLARLHAAGLGLAWDVVMGGGAPQGPALQARWAGVPGVGVAIAVDDMARRFAEADLFIGAGGSMTWERACLGLPGITLPIAANQQALCARLAAAGEGIDLGPFGPAALDAMVPALRSLIERPALVRAMGQALVRRCDGQGAGRVAEALLAGLAGADQAGTAAPGAPATTPAHGRSR